MRRAGRAFKLFGQIVFGEEEAAALEYIHGEERDALEDEEKDCRNHLTEMEESKARLLTEACITVEAHQERIKRATRTNQGKGSYALKVAESIKRSEEDAYGQIVQTFRDGRQKILANAFEQSEQTAREPIENQAMQRYAFFAGKHKKIQDLLATEQQGFHLVDPCGFSDEDDVKGVVPPSTK
jgi:hypothetical protein